MCLEEIDEKPEYISEGWKVFEAKDNKLLGVYIPYTFKTNEWVKDIRCGFIENRKHMIYETGFHFFFNREDAVYYTYRNNPEYEFKIRKVKVKNVIATGIQYIHINNKASVGVAKEIFIIE